MNLPIKVKSKLINPGIINDKYPYCISFTYFQSEQIIAYGSLNKVIIISNYLTIIDSLCEHEEKELVTAVAWAQDSGRLSSCGTDLKINIWEPMKNGWIHVNKIPISHIVNCISWNFLGTKFSIASKEFSIYDYQSMPKNATTLKPIFTEKTNTSFCAFSRDSRFILTLQKDNQVYIWYRSATSTNEYRRLILTHPSKVTSISWRLSEDVYQRCSFMSITEDGVARIWIETCVMERLSFHVAASIPTQHITAGCFIMTSSKMIQKNSIETDHYANGNGHYPTRDKNTRYSSVPDPREIERNKSWVLCFHRDEFLSVFEVSGLSLSVRSTPKIKRIMMIDLKKTQFLKMGRSFMPRISYIIATFIKQYTLTSKEIDVNKKKNDYIISLIFEDQRSHTLIAADIVFRSKDQFSIIGQLKGHRCEIENFRFHDSKPYMLSIDKNGTSSLFKVDDSDVYDPSLLVEFKLSIDNVQMADFVKNSDLIIGYNGRSIFLVNYDGKVQLNNFRLHSNFKSKDEILDLTVLYTEKRKNSNYKTIEEIIDLSASIDRILFVSLFPDVFYICSLEDNKVNIIYHLVAEEGDNFVTGVVGYLSTITNDEKKYVYRIATKKKIISIKLVLNEEGEEKPTIYFKSFDVDLEDDEEIVNIQNSRPATICIVTKKNIYMGRQLMSETSKIEILEKVPLDENANHNAISCLSNGFLAIACKKEIQLFFTGRKSHEFTQSLLSLNCISRYPVNNVSALKWMDNGILIYSDQGQISALTKFMNTFFLDSNIKLPTIHHSLVSLTFSVPDLHSTVISPLLISGRLNLISKMLKYFDKHFYENDCKVVLKKYILKMPPETNKEGKHICSKKLETIIDSLLEKIKEENQRIDEKEEDKEKKLFLLSNDCKTENNRLSFVINKMKSISKISFDILDKRALVYYRSFILSEKSHIPFDLICCALMSHEKDKLYKILNIQSWDDVERSGSVYWCDLNKLKETLVTISIRDFNSNRDLSIFFLVLFKRFLALNHLYATIGDNTRADFFIRDFSTPKNKKSALNNAFSALSKHTFHISAAMFILAGKFDTALNICTNNIQDYSLCYLLTRFSDDKTLELPFIKDVLIKTAKEKNDLAAISLFEYLAYDKEIDLSFRMRQMQPGFLYNDMRIYGDVRFCVCEVIKPTIETVRELSRSLLLAGHFFLATQYINYLNENLEDDIGNEINNDNDNNKITGGSNEIVDILSSREFDSDIVIKSIPKAKKESHLKRKFPSSVSFQALHKMPVIDNDDDEIVNEIEINKVDLIKSKYMSDDSFVSTDNDDDDYEDYFSEQTKHYKISNNNGTSDYGINSILGYSTTFDFDLDYEESSSEESNEDEEISDSDNENEFINNLKDDFKRSFGRSKSTNDFIVCNHPQLKKRKEILNEESTKFNLTESIQSNSLFSTKLVLFNTSRLRLETFLEQSLDLKGVEEIIPTLGKEIEKFDGRINSIYPSLRDFLIRTCKRCSFVYRRILLLPDIESQNDYIVSLCHSLANLPNLISSSYITTQQIAQVSHTIWCVSTFYNKKLFDQAFKEMRYVLASLTTGFFVVGCYNMNVDLLLTLLEQDLNTRKRYKFPQSLIDQIKVEISMPENISATTKLFEYDLDSINFISRKKVNVFSYTKNPNVSINENDLYHFMWLLFDMMLIDEFVCMIDQIQVDRIEYQQFFTSIKKMKNFSMQTFTYAILKYPVILQIDSLENVTIENKTVEKMYHFLLKKNNREQKIFAFCKDFYRHNSDINPFQITNVKEQTKLRNRQKIARFKGGITSFCMSKDTIWAATPQGLKQCNMLEYENDVNEGNDNDNELNVQFDEDVIDDPNILSEETLYSYSIDNLSLRESDTCPSFHHKHDKYRYASKKPYLVLSHPTEDYMLVSDYSGHVHARKYNESSVNNKISVFNTKIKGKCNSLGFQTAGTMFAVAQSSFVSLFSFCSDSYNKPYVTYNTYGSSVKSLAFVQGTGIFATCQKPSSDFDANVVFWDSILPPGSAMVSSLKVEKVGQPLKICFSPNYNNVIVGTNKGGLVLIDTRKYEILKIVKNAHERNIRALAIDQNESYCVTGGGEGTVKVWDMRSLNNIGEMKNVHSPRTVKTGQKWKSIAITDIHIKNDIIYTAGLDGNIKRIEFS